MIRYLKWLLLWAGLFLMPSAFAVCPLCTIAVGAGIGVLEWLGINDFITGIWVGGLVVSLSLWTSNWLHRKGWNFPLQNIVILIIYSVIIVVPLYYPLGYIGKPDNTLWHMDRLLLGIIIGGVVFFFATIVHFLLKIRHQGKVYFPLQQVVVPVSSLILLTIISYFLL